MGTAERQPYMQQAAADKARYESEMVTFAPDPASLKPTKGGKSLQKDPQKPKKPKYFGRPPMKHHDRSPTVTTARPHVGQVSLPVF